MPRALDTSLLRMAGRRPPAADPDLLPTPPANPQGDGSAAQRRSRSPGGQEHRAPESREPDRSREPLRPTGAALTDAQLSWLYKLEQEALRDRRRLSHSEIVRLAIDRQRRQDVSTVTARIEQGLPAHAPESTFALTIPQLRWLREVKGHALLRGENVSQADVIRAAVQVLVGASWNDLREEADDRLRPRGRPRAPGDRLGGSLLVGHDVKAR